MDFEKEGISIRIDVDLKILQLSGGVWDLANIKLRTIKLKATQNTMKVAY